MSLPEPIRKIRDAYLSGGASYEETWVALKALPKPWSMPEWKSKRDSLIGSACGRCGSTEPPMILQHTRQPQPFHKIRHEVTRRICGDPPSSLDIDPPVKKKDACPKCGSCAVRYMKTTKTWKCVGRKRYRVCGYEFETPASGLFEDRRDPKYKAARNRPYEEYQVKIEACKDEIQRAAMKESFRQSNVYWSMKHTVTRCKRCAFLEDRRPSLLRRDSTL